jgi:hypothetical protein
LLFQRRQIGVAEDELGAFSSHAPILPYLPKDDKNYIPIIIAIWYESAYNPNPDVCDEA